MRWRIRLVFAVATAVAGIIVSLDASSLPRRGWPTPSPYLLIPAMSVLAVSTLWQVIDAEIERRRVRRRSELRNEINKIMFPAWYKISRVGKNRAIRERIGVHVWIVPTWHWHLVPDFIRNLVPQSIRSLLPTPRMWRACIYRLEDNQHDGTDIRWKRDVGLPP